MSIDGIYDKVLDAERITPEEGVELFEQGNLTELGLLADSVCRRLHPEPVKTYVIDRNINYTNICTSGCKFCAFYRKPGDPEGYVLSTDEVLEKVGEAVELGATQILMQGGLNPDLSLEFFEDLLRAMKAHYDVHIHSFSAPEIAYFAKISELPVREVLLRLKAAGLASLPGGGAEMLVDDVRNALSPGKCSTGQWLDVMRSAAEVGLKATATMLFGHIESFADRIEHMRKMRDLQDETSVFTAFIPWTFQPGNTELGGETAGGHDYLRTLAISRIFLDNIPNIQASWVTQGDRMAQVSLLFGANDIGSTMIEENVVAATGCRYRLNEDKLISLINGAGFKAAQRNTFYDLLNHESPKGRKPED
jgi:cyclic dehypoxanthinyl futalosine synthase